MKLFILVTLIGAAVGQHGQGNLYPGFDESTGREVVAKCTYWQGVEASVCLTLRFKVDNRNMNQFRPNYNMYGMMNGYDKLFGNAQAQAEACSDGPKKDGYWNPCPASYVAALIDDSGDTNVWRARSGCAAGEEKCEMSCNLCGEENYITAAKEVEKKTNLRCLKIMDHFPFSCMEKKVVETALPSIFFIYLNEVVLEDATVIDEDMCVSFNFRRRASADCPLDSLSEISVCADFKIPFDSQPNQNCQLTKAAFKAYADGLGFPTEEKRDSLDDNNYCMFNVWRKAFFSLTNPNYENGATANELFGTELQIVVYRNVDHIDIDEVEIKPGDCSTQITSANSVFLTGNNGNGDFVGIMEVEF